MAAPIELPYINGRIEQMMPADDLVKKAFAPIEIGSQVQGRLIFQGWSIQPERFRKETPLMGIRVIDSHYKRFVDSTATEGSGVITPSYGEYPGLQQRFLN